MCLWIPGITQHILQLRINWFWDRKGLFWTHCSFCKILSNSQVRSKTSTPERKADSFMKENSRRSMAEKMVFKNHQAARTKVWTQSQVRNTQNAALLMLQQNCFYYQCLFLFVVDGTLTTNHWSVVNTTALENWTTYQNPSGGQREAGKKRERESDRQNDMKSEATAASVTLLSCLVLVSRARNNADTHKKH